LRLVLGTLRATALLGCCGYIYLMVLDLVLGTLRATTLLGFSRDLFGGILDLVLGSLRATALLGGLGDLSRWRGIPHKRTQEVNIFLVAASVDATITADGMVGSRSAPGTLNDSGGGGLLGRGMRVLDLVLGSLRATALLWFGGDLLGGVLRFVLGSLGATPLLVGVILKRKDEVLDLDLQRGGATVLGDGVHGDLGDKVGDMLGNINDVGHSLKVV
jgi:hypothetical protein